MAQDKQANPLVKCVYLGTLTEMCVCFYTAEIHKKTNSI